MEEIQQRVEKDERVLVTTLTKRMAEELTDYLAQNGVSCNYIHSDVETLDRVKIMDDLRNGVYDVLIGVNLLREGLDLPEVSLVAILDADKEGFLRSHRSLTQTVGRAARNVNGKAIFYADRITESMRKTMEETERRREKQIEYNTKHGMVPTQINKLKRDSSLSQFAKTAEPNAYIEPDFYANVAEPVTSEVYGDTKEDLKKLIEVTRRSMNNAAKKLEFLEAAQLRDQLIMLEDKLAKKR
jgi:excinuclease ABC subunit B